MRLVPLTPWRACLALTFCAATAAAACDDAACEDVRLEEPVSMLQTPRALAVATAGQRPEAAFERLPDAAQRLWFAMPPEDSRPAACRGRNYQLESLPKVAIVIPYLHENLTLIQHTLGSMLNNTPPSLLDEILLVDDGNEQTWNYESTLTHLDPKIKFHRNTERQGLIKAKKTGADLTTAPVILFMEPHCVVNRQWLEPLLARLSDGPRRIVLPVIDIMPEENTDEYTYIGDEGQYGGFKWDMNFNWFGTPTSRNASYVLGDAFPMPAMSGGILAMWRSWWEESGKYDDEMKDWGGEHIELSLRSWRCGGSVEAVPCSRISHMFRKAAPYKDDQSNLIRNKKRVVAVWLDNYTSFAERQDPAMKDMSDVGDLSERLALKSKLNCKSMEWYVQNVYPELLNYTIA